MNLFSIRAVPRLGPTEIHEPDPVELDWETELHPDLSPSHHCPSSCIRHRPDLHSPQIRRRPGNTKPVGRSSVTYFLDRGEDVAPFDIVVDDTVGMEAGVQGDNGVPERNVSVTPLLSLTQT